jgi:hypothetical protein
MAESEEKPARKRSVAVDLLAAYTVVLGLIHLAVASVALYWVVKTVNWGLRELRLPHSETPATDGGALLKLLAIPVVIGMLVAATSAALFASAMSITELSMGARLIRRRSDSRTFALLIGGVCSAVALILLWGLFDQWMEGHPDAPMPSWIGVAVALIHAIYAAVAFSVLLNRSVAEEFGVIFPPRPGSTSAAQSGGTSLGECPEGVNEEGIP